MCKGETSESRLPKPFAGCWGEAVVVGLVFQPTTLSVTSQLCRSL